MKISVCMGIYNGEKYIREQLGSILQQTLKADEVILCDDNSGDRTVEIVQKFIAENQLQESWKLYQSRENKGYPRNFYYAMSLCTGDLVFLSDQDDIWHSEKIQKMVEQIEKHPDAKVVSCKFGLIDAEGKDIHTVMAPTRNRGTGQIRHVTIGDVYYKCEWPGMVMAYRNAWYQTWQTESSQIPHDFLICARAAEEQGFLQLDEELAYHRRHDNNAGGEEHRFSRLLNKQRKLKEIEVYLNILYAFGKEEVLQTQDGKEALQQKLLSMQGRYDALQSGKINRVIKNAWKYRKEMRLATVMCDVAIVKKAGVS